MAEFEVAQPIICSPFEEPREHWLIQEGAEPRRVTERVERPSSTACATACPVARGELAWDDRHYAGLLEYWRRDGHDPGKRLFFAHLNVAAAERWAADVNADGQPGTSPFAVARSVAAFHEILAHEVSTT
ncbi:MAG TPA: hypothetical protein VM364_11575 [Vicinamibacterales bacterium]|nr:hypothetical protein [Vicinamibacterales bacterium]